MRSCLVVCNGTAEAGIHNFVKMNTMILMVVNMLYSYINSIYKLWVLTVYVPEAAVNSSHGLATVLTVCECICLTTIGGVVVIPFSSSVVTGEWYMTVSSDGWAGCRFLWLVSRGFQVAVSYGQLPVSPASWSLAGPVDLVRSVGLLFKWQQLRVLSIWCLEWLKSELCLYQLNAPVYIRINRSCRSYWRRWLGLAGENGIVLWVDRYQRCEPLYIYWSSYRY